MEVDWQQYQLEQYLSDGEQMLQRLAAGEDNEFLLERALGLLTTYLSIPRQMVVDRRLDEVMVKLARILFEDIWPRGYWSQIALWWPQLIVINQPFLDPSLKIRLTHQLSIIKCNLGEVKESMAYLLEPLITSTDFALASSREQAGMLHHVSAWYIHLGEYAKAAEHLNRCFALADQANLWDLKAYALNLLGNTAQFRGDFDRAWRCYKESLRILTENDGEDECACVAYQSLGRLFIIQGQFRKATPLIERGLAIRRRWGEREGIANNAVYLAQAYLGGDRVVEAETLLDEALTIHKSLSFPPGIILCHLGFGQLETKRGCYSQAIAHYRQALEILHQNPMPSTELQILSKLLPLLLRTGSLRELLLISARLLKNCRQQKLSLAGAWRLVTTYIK